MPMFDRSASTGIEVIDEWDGGFGWIAHPDEDGHRASHAIRAEDGVWLFDPLDGPDIDDRIDDLGTVAGVAVLSAYHGRDVAAFAARYDVPVYLATWMDRVADRVDAPLERYEAPTGEWVELGDSGIDVRTIDPLTAWREVIAYRAADGTLRVPDMLWTPDSVTVGDERIACYLFHRLAPPREPFADLEPERVLVGHGEGVTEDAAAALESSLEGARRRLPRALVSQAPTNVRGLVSALRD